MSSYGDALAAMTRAAEAVAEASEMLGRVSSADVDAGLVERVRRRLENAAAQVELDRRALVVARDERSRA